MPLVSGKIEDKKILGHKGEDSKGLTQTYIYVYRPLVLGK